MKDSTGLTLKLGHNVLVPEPIETDIHNHEFVGSVINFHGEYVRVSDMDDNFFDIEPERLTILEDE